MTVSSTEGDADLGAAEEIQDVNPAESSDAESQGAVSLEDAVNTALKGEQEETPASEEPDPEGSESDSDEDETELSEEEQSRLSERAQRRIRELVEKRKTAEGEIAQVREELDTLKPKAERMDELTGYMQQHEISPQHLNNALGLTAMINKGDYTSALPVLENLIQQVRNSAGEVLPDDLQQRVNLGYITEADAKELHKARLSEKRTRESADRDRERSEAERRQQETQAVVTQTVQTADGWSQEQAQSDPDWNLKRDRVTEKVELELRRLGPEGYPRTTKDVRALLDKVKQDVEGEIKRYRPQQRPINPSPTGGSSSPRSVAKPSSLMDAVNQGLAASE